MLAIAIDIKTTGKILEHNTNTLDGLTRVIKVATLVLILFNIVKTGTDIKEKLWKKKEQS